MIVCFFFLRASLPLFDIFRFAAMFRFLVERFSSHRAPLTVPSEVDAAEALRQCENDALCSYLACPEVSAAVTVM